jgi:CO dehydrogenase nickel-insertion accessory protein CooC1
MSPLREWAKENLRGRRVLVAMAGNGGVGKNAIATLLAIAREAPLIDLDLFGVAERLHGKEGIELIEVLG